MLTQQLSLAKAGRNLVREHLCRGRRPGPPRTAPRGGGSAHRGRAGRRPGRLRVPLRCRGGTFRDHGAALQSSPVRVAASSALQARTGALLLRPRRAVRGQHGGQLQGGRVHRARTGPLRGPGLLRHTGSGAAHGAQLGRSVPAIAGLVSARPGRPGRVRSECVERPWGSAGWGCGASGAGGCGRTKPLGLCRGSSAWPSHPRLPQALSQGTSEPEVGRSSSPFHSFSLICWSIAFHGV